jgi:uncharacterized protein YbjQ (UPF0145 family)
MLKHFGRVVLVAVLAFQWSGCSTSTAFINYDNIDSSTGVKVKADSFSGTNMGAVKGDEGGAIWSNCSEKAADSVRSMMAQAKMAGANAVGDLKWYASGNAVASCKKGWGYLVIWPFILTPLFMSTAVTGTMYKISGKKVATSGVYFIPDTTEAQLALARSIVAN